jgi:outer membrane protein W
MKRIILFVLISIPVWGQSNGKEWSISINSVYTTSAKIYLNPNSSDNIIRYGYFPLQGIVSPQVEFMYQIDEDILLSLSLEYMKSTSSGFNLTAISGNNTVSVLVEDGFLMIPIEFSGYYILPFSSEKFKFLMGGGVGYYIGSQIRKFGDEDVSNVSRPSAYGIHVMLTMDYMIKENIAIRGEMKFRDPQFNVTTKYNKLDVNYNGGVIHLNNQTFDSKINVDGISFILGITFHF